MKEQSTFSRSIRLTLFFAVALSLMALPGPLSSGFHLPSIQLGHASTGTVVPNQSWVPAGAATNTELVNVYTSPGTQFNALCAGSVTTEDWPLSRAQIDQILSPTGCGSNSFSLSQPIGEHGYFEIEFNQAANFWGCFFNYGNSACGQEIRQAIAHLINKDTFARTNACTADATTGPVCGALDNAPPRGDELVTPQPCTYDTIAGYAASGTACTVGHDLGTWTAGAAYDCGTLNNGLTHTCASPQTGTGGFNGDCGALGALVAPTSCPGPGISGAVTASGTLPWMNGFGTADFCAASQHIIRAFADLSVTVTADPASCVLNGAGHGSANSALQTTLTGHPVNFMIRSSNPRNELGTGLITSMCAVITGAFDFGCTTGSGDASVANACPNQSVTSSFVASAILCGTQGPITSFPGFTTSATGAPTNGANGNSFSTAGAWEMYTAGFLFVFPADGPIYFAYDSVQTSQTTGSPCNAQVLTGAAGDYQYICDAVFDAYAAQLEFGSCTSPTVGTDPSSGQTAPTFGTCQSITSPGIAVGAAAKITNAPLGTSYPVAITITGIGGFGGSGTMTAASSNTAAATVTPASQSVTLPAGDSIAPIVTVTFPSTATAGSTSTITVTVTIGATTYTITMAVSIAASSSNAGLCLTACANLNGVVPSLSANSAGYLAEREHALRVLTLPVFGGIDTFAYLAPPTAGANPWLRIINQVGIGATANFWTWLNAWNAGSQTLNVGFSETPDKLNPLSASTVWDLYIYGNIWDSLFASPTPYFAGAVSDSSNGGLIDWLTNRHQFPLANGALGYTPPAGTIETLRAFLNPAATFHDGQPLTAFDVAMSYNFLIKDGSFQAGGLLGIVSGITVLGPYEFDINLSQKPFSEAGLGGVTILPGHLWSNCNTIAGWNSFVSSQTFPLTVPIGITGTACSLGGAMDSVHTSVTFDPVSSGLLVGSGPWECQGTSGGNVGKPGIGCTSSGSQSATGNGAYTLTRNGCTIISAAPGITCVNPASPVSLVVPPGTPFTAPAPAVDCTASPAAPAPPNCTTPSGTVQSTYFRSPSTFARYIWTGIAGNSFSNNGFSVVSQLSTCSQFAGTTYQASPPLSTACLPYENGIGSTGAQAGSYSFTGCDGTNHCNVQLSQILLAQIFVNDYKDWTQPIAFPYTTSTLIGAAPLNPTLYEGTSTLQSSTNGGSCTTGWTQSNEATVGYDC